MMSREDEKIPWRTPKSVYSYPYLCFALSLSFYSLSFEAELPTTWLWTFKVPCLHLMTLTVFTLWHTHTLLTVYCLWIWLKISKKARTKFSSSWSIWTSEEITLFIAKRGLHFESWNVNSHMVSFCPFHLELFSP